MIFKERWNRPIWVTMIGNLEVLVTRNEYLLWDYNLVGFCCRIPLSEALGLQLMDEII